MKFQQTELGVIQSFREETAMFLAPDTLLGRAILYKFHVSDQCYAVVTEEIADACL